MYITVSVFSFFLSIHINKYVNINRVRLPLLNKEKVDLIKKGLKRYKTEKL